MNGTAHFEVYPQDRKPSATRSGGEPTGEFGWRFRAANGQITFIGGEGFTRREDAHRAVHGAAEDILALASAPEPILREMRENAPILDVDE